MDEKDMELEWCLIPGPEDPVSITEADFHMDEHSSREQHQQRYEELKRRERAQIAYARELYELGLSKPGQILGHVPEAVLRLAATLGPPLGTDLGAWLNSRYGRKVRIKVGDVEVEAQTAEEVEKLLTKARDYKEASEPKRIISG